MICIRRHPAWRATLAAAILLMGPVAAFSQEIERLPPIDAYLPPTQPEFMSAAQLHSEPGVIYGLPEESNMILDGWDESQKQLPGFKADSFFQKLSFATTHLFADSTTNQMAITELELVSTFALPAPTKDHPLLISPTFETRFTDGPSSPDVPGDLYSAYMQFIWVPRINAQWSAILGVEPGVYSDFKTSADGIRILGRALGRYQVEPDRLEFVAGVLYLDRDDVPFLPAGGVIWVPNNDVRLDLIFPIPKVGYRFFFDGVEERWMYAAGEFGGDTWAVQRADGTNDQLILRDWRFSLGLEKRYAGGAGARLEVGYVFSRTIEYVSDSTPVNLDDTWMVRAVLSY
ncbi:DUF6268 family outer membrane beta-barrel protein [Lignipirellula cremea]|uniref:Uncharacterized protein n=1 Tax=Lignipirellula cremea TaxID=2528010 RepID=A0A518E2M1_9BACT|nr:DUF6268 family outer membrane beta-barrel protein [Lignipirellula cremea]QDU98341.1 hypothetical protein Pla8534_62080 [Lignipirellula cremea]